MNTGERCEHLAVVGLGYVGCVTAACLAEIGHYVTGVDIDQAKVACVQAGKAPFHEPGLEPLIRRNVELGRLRATASMSDALAAVSIVVICVGTPSDHNGDQSLEQLRRVSAEIGKAWRGRRVPGTKQLLVVVRSTVFPGTCTNVVQREMASANVQVVSNPEFLREGNAVNDFMHPALIVIGGNDHEAMEHLASVYASLAVEPCMVSLRAAEIIKYACNAFHAVKIAFANEMGSLCGSLQIQGNEVLRALCLDTKLNISPAYLNPGFAFGGSCLPKDLRALEYRSVRSDLELPMLRSILPSNGEHLRRAIRAALDTSSSPIGIYGLAFKEETDDLRESPAVALIEALLGKGRRLRVFDPHIRLDGIRGTNRSFLLTAIPHIRRLLEVSLDDFLSRVKCVLLTQKPSAAALYKIEHAGLQVLDLTDPAQYAGPAAREASMEAALGGVRVGKVA